MASPRIHETQNSQGVTDLLANAERRAMGMKINKRQAELENLKELVRKDNKKAEA